MDILLSLLFIVVFIGASLHVTDDIDSGIACMMYGFLIAVLAVLVVTFILALIEIAMEVLPWVA